RRAPPRTGQGGKTGGGDRPGRPGGAPGGRGSDPGKNPGPGRPGGRRRERPGGPKTRDGPPCPGKGPERGRPPGGRRLRGPGLPLLPGLRGALSEIPRPGPAAGAPADE